MTNSREMTVEVTGGILHSKAMPVIATLQLPPDETDQRVKIPAPPSSTSHFFKRLWPESLRTATIIASGNERFVFDTQYLGRVPGSSHREARPQYEGFMDFPKHKYSKPPETEHNPVAVFQVCSRIEFPPTSLDFFVVGPATDTDSSNHEKTSLSSLAKQPTSSIELKGKIKELKQPTEKQQTEGQTTEEGKEGVSSMITVGKGFHSEEIAKTHLVKRWPGSDSNRLVWFLWWKRQYQQMFVGILLRRFHKYVKRIHFTS